MPAGAAGIDADLDASFHDGLAAQQGMAAVVAANAAPGWIPLDGARVRRTGGRSTALRSTFSELVYVRRSANGERRTENGERRTTNGRTENTEPERRSRPGIRPGAYNDPCSIRRPALSAKRRAASSSTPTVSRSDRSAATRTTRSAAATSVRKPPRSPISTTIPIASGRP